MKCRKREQHISGKQTAQDFGWRKDYKILAPTWVINSYKFNNQNA